MVGVEQPQLLGAVHAVEGVVDIEDDALGHLSERGTVLLDQRPPQAQQRPSIGQVLQPRDRRLRAQLVIRGQPPQRHLEHRVAPQHVGVVAVLVTGGDHQHPETDNLGQAVLNPLRRPRVPQTPRQPIGHAEPALDLAQRQQPAFRGQPTAVKASDDGLAPNR